jgi:K+-sensing histidine kinase KdpD
VLRAPLLAVVVTTPADESAPSERVRRVRELLDDATDLGAEILMVEAADVAEGVATVAKARRVTRLIIAHHPTTTLERVRKSPLAERILMRLPTLEITIVADAREHTDAFQVGRGD